MVKKAPESSMEWNRRVKQRVGMFLFRLKDLTCILGIILVICFALYGYTEFASTRALKDPVSLLVRAAYHNNVEGVQFLLDKGVNPNEHDFKENTALDVALFRGANEATEILRDAGANEGLSSWRKDMLLYEGLPE